MSKIKHIDTSFHQIINEVKKESIKLFWALGKEMLKNEFTKPFPRPAFEDKRARIEVVDVGGDC